MDNFPMSFSKVHSAQIHFLKAYCIDVEVDLSKGLNHFAIVGLPDKAVAESKDRVGAAIKNCGFESPKSKNQKDRRNQPNTAPILSPVPFREIVYEKREGEIDFKDIKGQEHAKRALEISACGAHNIMMYGPPGTGKTMLAKAYSHILPKLSF